MENMNNPLPRARLLSFLLRRLGRWPVFRVDADILIQDVVGWTPRSPDQWRRAEDDLCRLMQVLEAERIGGRRLFTIDPHLPDPHTCPEASAPRAYTIRKAQVISVQVSPLSEE